MRHVAHLVALAEPDDGGEVVLDDAEVVAVVRDVRGEQQRVAPADDALLAQVGRVPIDFVHQLVGLHDLGRLGESLADLREEGDVAVRDGLVVPEAGVGELLRRGAPWRARRARACAGRSTAGRPPTRGASDAATTPQAATAAASKRCMHRKVAGVSHAGQARRHCTSHAMSFDDIPRAARARNHVVPVWRDCLLDTDTPVTAFAKLRRGAVRLPARVGARRRRDVGALHLPRQRAARRVAAARRRGGRLDAGSAAGTARGGRPIRSPISNALLRARTPVEVPELGDVLERRGRLLQLRRRAAHRAAAVAAAARRSRCPTRCSSSPTRW